MNRPPRTGRAQRVRDFMASTTAPVSTRTVCDATDPSCSVTRMAATLACLAESGYVARSGDRQDGVLWRFVTLEPARAHKSRRPHRSLGNNAEHATAAARQAKKTATTKGFVREQPTNFSAPLDTVAERWSPKRQAADAIAADVSAFVRNGGFVQHLVHGEGSQPLRTMPFQQDGPAAVATPARQRNRAA